MDASLKTTLQHHRFVFYLIFLVPMVITMVVYQYGTVTTHAELLFHASRDYLINTPHCQLPNLNAWNPDAKRFYKKESYVSCSSLPLLSSVKMNENNTIATLHIAKEFLKKYSKGSITCCVNDVNRDDVKDIDNKISYSKCRTIHNHTIKIKNDRPTRITCRAGKKEKEVYKNIHVPIAVTPQIISKQQKFKSYARPLNVMLIGIDSISRLNMIRTMPKTRSFLLNDSAWLEYKVFHKIGDNTFPNLMALLTGKANDDAYKNCNPKEVAGIDKCDFMWKRFGERNYVTAYVEDSAAMSTFNYKKKGFTTPPTDYYMRTYQLACSKLRSKAVDNAVYCSGPEMEGERIFRLAKEFARVHRSNPYFGFFWMNSYSHQMLNTPTRMDAKIRDYMQDISKLADNNTVMIFISDHGIRFGSIRHTLTGYIEERMPFLFMKFPAWFREDFSEEYHNLQINTERLVTPYDLYMTLQDILQYSGFDYDIQQSEGCQNCHSLFAPVDINRSCDDVAISTHWCTCLNYRHEEGASKLAARSAKYVLKHIESTIAKKNATSKCAKYSVSKIVNTYRSQCFDGGVNCDQNFLVVTVATKPEATFEATLSIKYIEEKRKAALKAGRSVAELDDLEDVVQMKVYSGVSRLDSYAHSGRCVEDTDLKLVCSCK